jgi:hypothetical protein
MGVKFGEFDMAHGCWKNYIERFTFCLEASEIKEDDKKKANLLAVCGPDLYDLVISLISPTKVSEVTFSTIVSIISNHFHPKPNEIIQSYKFHSKYQEEGERIRDFIAHLRKLSIDCNFTDLDRTLRDRLVCGIRDKEIQKKLLQHSTMTFDDACQIALSHEAAGIDSNIIVTASSTKTTCDLEVPMEVNKFINKKTDKQMERMVCFRCGRAHRGPCRFRWSKCNQCGKTGHIEAVCSVKGKNLPKSEFNGLYEDIAINNMRQDVTTPAFMLKIKLSGVMMDMEVDSGCAFSLISEQAARQVWQGQLPIMEDVGISLKTWTDSRLCLLGKTKVLVQYKETKKSLPVLVAQGKGPSLIGRNWFTDLGIHLLGVNSIKFDQSEVDTKLKEIQHKYAGVFQEGLGRYTGPVVSIIPKEGSKPVFYKSRPVPFALKDRIYEEIDRLESEGVLEATSHSEWATPIVPVLKQDGRVRLCGDYRSTVNAVTDTDTYPLPTLSEAFAELQGGVLFTKIDLERAYTQVIVDEATADLLTLNTPKGLYKTKRLPFGVKACPGIFQRLMSSLLAGIPGVAVLLDDIVVTGGGVQEHNRRLEEVLKKLQDAGLRVNKNKCKFAARSVQFLGFVIDEFGIHPCVEKIRAIEKTPPPRNVKELQAFLGLINFYDRFMPHKASVAEPLYRLLDKEGQWKWEESHQEAFEKMRKMLSSKDTLVHYDLKKKLILSCDASHYGLGAVLEHEMSDGSVRPVMFASRTMNAHERNYAQIDKEAAAIIFGLKKFHQFISGRRVIIKTDHKPLLGIFDSKRPIPNIISPRMLRWALLLNSYDYDIQYVEGKKIGNADALSRWPSHEESSEEEYSGVLLIEETPIELEFTAREVANLTKRDKCLSRVLYWLRNGWPGKSEEDYKIYWQKRDELSMYKDCILWGNRVVIPEKMRAKVLEELHMNHDGIVITKAMARSYFWWPAMDKQIENLVKNCNVCAENRNLPPKVTHQWIRPNKAWSRLHLDYAGPFQGKTFLIIIDAYSKWPEVKIVPDMSSSTLIRILRDVFAEQGLPDVIVSDNGRSFVSDEFRKYLESEEIRQVLSAPYHPATNGQAERTVQTVKAKLRKLSSGPWNIRLPSILYGLRTTPNSVQDKTPAELLNNRRFRTRFDKLNPLSFRNADRDETIEENSNTKIREFQVGQSVYIKNYSNGPRWLKGTVEKRVGTCRYLVKWSDKLLMRHINQMLSCGGRGQQTVREKTTTVAEDDDYDDEGSRVSIPSPHRWADIIGVSGPQDIAIQQSSQDVATTSSHKRARAGTPPESPDSKRIALADSDSELDRSEGSDTRTGSE